MGNNMKINVDDFIPEWADSITGEYPSMFLFCDEKENIIEAEVGSGSVRESELLDYYDKNYYSYEYLVEFSEKPIKEGATNIITGYYDTIEKEFIFFKKYDFTPNEGRLSIDFVKNMVNEFFPHIHNLLYKEEKLLELNLKNQNERSLFKFSDKKEFKSINLPDIYNLIKEKISVSENILNYLDENLNVEELKKIKDSDIKNLTNKEIDFFLNYFNVNKNNVFDFFNICRVYGLFDLYITNEEKEVDLFFSLKVFGDDVIKNKEKYFIRFTLNKRLVESIKNERKKNVKL